MEFFHLIKATQKSGKQDAVIWFSAKSEARAALLLDVELEEAGIETGRGKDYAKPIRTDMPVVNDLPEEGVVDYSWCERYELQDDCRTWLPKGNGEADAPTPTTPETTVKGEPDDANVPLENRNPAVRFAVHLASDKYHTHITKEQQIAASEMVLDGKNTYFHILMVAHTNTPEVAELSLNAEWKLIQAIKQVFAPDEEHEAELIAAFMGDWVEADAGNRNQVVENWLNEFSQRKAVSDVKTNDADSAMLAEKGLRIDEHDDETTRYPVVQMPFRKQLLAQFASDELRHHVTREEFAALGVLEMDTDNSYVQNLLLAAESCPELKSYDTKDLWRYTDAIRKVFSQDKRHELALVLRFTRIWAATDYINRGILAREWAAGNRISDVQRTDTGTNADGGFITDRGEGAHHNLDTLDLEIACALLPMDFNHLEIPGSIHRRAKDIVASKEQPWKSWSANLRNQPGILSVNRAAIFNLVRIAPENIHLTPVAHLEFINQTMTAEFNAATELVTVPAPAAKSGEAEQPVVGGKTDRNPNYKHDFDGLDTEIALATLSTDFNIYDIPSDVFRKAKAIVAANDSPFKEWSEVLRATPNILDYSRAAIFALIRSAHPEYYKYSGRLAGYIAANLTETDHENPTAEMLAAARHTPEVSWESEVNEQVEAEKAAASQPQVENLGSGMFSIDGLMGGNTDPVINTTSNEVEKTETVTETTSNVQMEAAQPEKVEATDTVSPGESADATDSQADAVADTVCDDCGIEGGGGCPDCSGVAGDATYVAMEAGLKEGLEHGSTNPETLFTHLMVDLETMGKKPGAPIVSMGAVFFDPASGKTGAEHYQVINLESSMSFGARPDASTILWWLKQSPEARSAIVVDDTVGLVEALERLLDFIAENAANGSKNVQLWGNGSSFDCSLLEAAFELADTPFPIPHWNYRDVRTVVELGKAVGLNARYDIPFDGDQHNALADARHQVKYVSAIWQRLTAN